MSTKSWIFDTKIEEAIPTSEIIKGLRVVYMITTYPETEDDNILMKTEEMMSHLVEGKIISDVIEDDTVQVRLTKDITAELIIEEEIIVKVHTSDIITIIEDETCRNAIKRREESIDKYIDNFISNNKDLLEETYKKIGLQEEMYITFKGNVVGYKNPDEILKGVILGIDYKSNKIEVEIVSIDRLNGYYPLVTIDRKDIINVVRDGKFYRYLYYYFKSSGYCIDLFRGQ